MIFDTPSTFQGWVQAAISAEKEVAEDEEEKKAKRLPKCEFCGRFGHTKSECRSFKASNAAKTTSSSTGTQPKATTSAPVCSYCNKPGLQMADCFKANGICFKCKQQGHQIKDCPNAESKNVQG